MIISCYIGLSHSARRALDRDQGLLRVFRGAWHGDIGSRFYLVLRWVVGPLFCTWFSCSPWKRKLIWNFRESFVNGICVAQCHADGNGIAIKGATWLAKFRWVKKKTTQKETFKFPQQIILIIVSGCGWSTHIYLTETANANMLYMFRQNKKLSRMRKINMI